jgi:hypothetical protein
MRRTSNDARNSKTNGREGQRDVPQHTKCNAICQLTSTTAAGRYHRYHIIVVKRSSRKDPERPLP